jgi:hypothetical protein
MPCPWLLILHHYGARKGFGMPNPYGFILIFKRCFAVRQNKQNFEVLKLLEQGDPKDSGCNGAALP